jgi:exodeoxyribonuclease VII large subunit
MATNLHEFTVSEIAFALKKTIEDAYGLVRVRGEISGFKRAASGHLYLALKDDKAVLDGVCWRGTATRLGFQPEDGLEVICTGRLTTYPGRSRYQLVIEHMEPAGAGALMALFEERKQRLAAEGLFAEDRKRPLPYLPERIGIVTSPTGAVIRDILHRLAERFPRHVLLWPVLVQGEGAAEQIAGAVQGFERLAAAGTIPPPDVLIVARGGGSIEDLWAFNEEIVARAVAACGIPVISAVGHETDTTLIDFVADRRAPTPTAAAEIAVPVRAELLAVLDGLGERLIHGSERGLAERRRHLDGLVRGLPDPAAQLRYSEQRLDDLGERLRLRTPLVLLDEKQERLGTRHARMAELARDRLRDSARDLDRLPQAKLDGAIMTALASLERRLDGPAKLLESLSHRRVLERGYALVHGARGLVIRSTDAGKEKRLEIEFADGRLGVVPEGDGLPNARARAQRQALARSGPAREAKAAKPQADKPRTDKAQGSLL